MIPVSAQDSMIICPNLKVGTRLGQGWTSIDQHGVVLTCPNLVKKTGCNKFFQPKNFTEVGPGWTSTDQHGVVLTCPNLVPTLRLEHRRPTHDPLAELGGAVSPITLTLSVPPDLPEVLVESPAGVIRLITLPDGGVQAVVGDRDRERYFDPQIHGDPQKAALKWANRVIKKSPHRVSGEGINLDNGGNNVRG